MSAELRRPLSPVERWYWIADQVSPLNVIARVHLSGSIGAGLLERAAAALVAEHPLLRVAITSDADGTNPAFVPSARGCPVRIVPGDEFEWERQVDEHELGESLDWRRGPLVRVVDVALDPPRQEHDLVLTVSHIIADGTTALSLLRRLIEHADRLAAQAPDGEPVRSRPAVGAPEDLLPARYRGTRGVVRIAATGLGDLLAAAATRPARLLPEAAVPPSRRTTRLVRRTLTATQLDCLTQRCRAEGVTVHGALAAAMAIALGPAAAQGYSGRTRARMCVGSPIDFRAELDPPVSPDEAGAYVCTVPSIVHFGGERDLWSIAREVNSSLGRRRRIGQHFALLAALRFMCPGSVAKSSAAFGLLERYGPGNVCLSNLGPYGFGDRIGRWQLSGAQFMSGVSISGYFLATVNTSHDHLFWNFTYIDGAVSHESAQRYADGCVQTLLQAIAPTPGPTTPPVQSGRCAMGSSRRGQSASPSPSASTSPSASKSVVITGASSGLGRAAAIHLSGLGYRVFAGVRSESSAAELAAEFACDGASVSRPAGELIPVLLDVTDAASIAQVGERIEGDCADTGLWAVVNNAGVSISAPLECVPMDVVRTQLETNVIGALAVSQRFLPLLRAAGGRIVNVSSGIGNIAPPYLGVYAASQFAKEGLSDSLRRELRPLGVNVSVIQPGAVYTPIWGKIRQSAREILAAAPDEVVDSYRARFIAFMNMNEVRAQASKTTTADYAKAVAAALADKHPKSRYRVGADSRSSALARRVLPDRVMDAVLAVGVRVMARSDSTPGPEWASP
jgi:NAD(P)-dependent dehydrogenase (short-subunit alcohol dehydrogenase family)